MILQEGFLADEQFKNSEYNGQSPGKIRTTDKRPSPFLIQRPTVCNCPHANVILVFVLMLKEREVITMDLCRTRVDRARRSNVAAIGNFDGCEYSASRTHAHITS